jgi:hypothetical protein
MVEVNHHHDPVETMVTRQGRRLRRRRQQMGFRAICKMARVTANISLDDRNPKTVPHAYALLLRGICRRFLRARGFDQDGTACGHDA